MPPFESSASPSPVITGLGLITPLGFSAWETLRALLDGRTTADRLQGLPERADPVMIARATGGSAFAVFSRADASVDLAERTVREALADAGLHDQPRGGPEREAIRAIVASSKGSVGALLDKSDPQRRAECATLGPHAFLCRHLQARLCLGDTTAIVAACATSIAALHQAVREIESGRAPRVLVIAVESAMLPLFVHAYRRLGVLAPMSPSWDHIARPLDRRRAGFTLCECAAAVVIEDATERGSEAPMQAPALARAKARLLGVAIGTQPDDMVRAPREFTTLTRLVRRVAPPDRPIALLQPHATATADNDERELAALAEALGDRARHTPVYANKGALGHALGAAGLVSLVLGCLIARAKRRPIMGWLQEPVACPFPLSLAEQPIGPGPQLCVAAGFGGHVGAVCFEPV